MNAPSEDARAPGRTAARLDRLLALWVLAGALCLAGILLLAAVYGAGVILGGGW